MILVNIAVALAFLLNFYSADLHEVIVAYDSLLSPPPFAYSIYLLIYACSFGFVCYQLVNRNARRSWLIQKRLAWIYILHQCAFACWLKEFSAGSMLVAAACATACLVLSLAGFCSITREFRNGRYEKYSAEDWVMIEAPWAVNLGWETFACVLSWNAFAVRVAGSSSHAFAGAVELAAFIIGLIVLGQAAVLYAGLPALMNPLLHLGLVWGCGSVCYRWLAAETDTPHTLYLFVPGTPRTATPLFAAGIDPTGIRTACGLASGILALTALAYFMVSLVIMGQSKFCLPLVLSNDSPPPSPTTEVTMVTARQPV